MTPPPAPDHLTGNGTGYKEFFGGFPVDFLIDPQLFD
jgi:hypothetical protein